LLTIERVPCTPPATFGSKLTATLVDCLGVSVMFVPPVATKPVPATETFVMVTFVLPVFVNPTSFVELDPTVTFPKLTVVVLGDNWTLDVVPAPLKLTTRGEPSALLEIEIVPVKLPTSEGLKLPLKDMVWPAGNVSGRERPVTKNPGPPYPTLVTVRSAVLGFEIWMV